MHKGIKKMKNNNVEHKRSITFKDLSIRTSVRSLLMVCYSNKDGNLMRNPYPFGNLMGVLAVCQI